MKDLHSGKKAKKHANNHFWYLFSLPVVLGILFFVTLHFDTTLETYLSTHEVNPSPIFSFQPKSYPTKTWKSTPSLSAQSAIVLDNDTKVILFSKKATEKQFPASTTKMMTALTALSFYHLSDVLTIKTSGVEGSVVGFFPGEHVTFHDLLYGMLLPSGNDAAVAIADNYPGGRSAFVAAMNSNASRYHLSQTHFVDPDGLDDGNYTTARDLAMLASLALQNPVFKEIVATKEILIGNAEGSVHYAIENLNKLLGSYGVNGVKTGYTDKAGQVLATSKDENGHTLIIVVMQSDDRFADTLKLLQMLTGHVTFASIGQ